MQDKSLYDEISCSMDHLDGCLQLSWDFQAYTQSTMQAITSSIDWSGERWQSLESKIEETLANVVSKMGTAKLEKFEPQYITVVFYSALANFAIDRCANATFKQRKWPRLNSNDDKNARNRSLINQINAAINATKNKSCAQPAKQRLDLHGKMRKHAPLRAHTSRFVKHSNEVPCTSTGHYASGCRACQK